MNPYVEGPVSRRRGSRQAKESVGRTWGLSEYSGADLSDDGEMLRMGNSQLRSGEQGPVKALVKECTAVFRPPVDVQMTFVPEIAPPSLIRLLTNALTDGPPISLRGTAFMTRSALITTGRHNDHCGDTPLSTDGGGWSVVGSNLDDATRVSQRHWGGVARVRLFTRDSAMVTLRELVPEFADGSLAPQGFESPPLSLRATDPAQLSVLSEFGCRRHSCSFAAHVS